MLASKGENLARGGTQTPHNAPASTQNDVQTKTCEPQVGSSFILFY
jgi:hypothetical protein